MGGSGLGGGMGTPVDVCVLASTGPGSRLDIGISSGGSSDIVTLFLGFFLELVTF